MARRSDLPNTLRLVYDLRQIMKSCYSPCGSLHILQTAAASTISSIAGSSTVLLKSLTFPEPLVELILQAIKSHLKNYGDGGLFLGLLCCELLIRCMGITNNRSKINALAYSWCMRESLDVMRGDDFEALSKFSISDDIMLDVIQSVVYPKLSRILEPAEIAHIEFQCRNAFILTEGDVSRLRYEPSVGASVDSMVHDGLLLDQAHASQLGCLKSGCRSTVAVFACSLSGDSPDLMNVIYEVRSDDIDIELFVLEKARSVLISAINCGAQLIACQKVIHPKLKKIIKQHKVDFIERLGSSVTTMLLTISGAIPVQSLQESVTKPHLGTVEILKKRLNSDKELFILRGFQHNVYTFVLHHWSPSVMAEMQVACEAATRSLQTLAREPGLLRGGAWQEAVAAALVRRASCDDGSGSRCIADEELQTMGLNRSEFTSLVTAFGDALTALSGMPKGQQHSSAKPVTWYDIKCEKESAIQAAVVVANAILSTCQTIKVTL